jgi:hypothetical protein
MASQEHDEEQEQEQDVLLTVKERAEPLRFAALASHGYLDPNGVVLDGKIEDKLFALVLTAECYKTAERKAKAITRTQLTRHIVPQMPGPGDYDETNDPEAAQQAWTDINELIWRQLDHNDGGRVQMRLNGEHALVLCRTDQTGEKGVLGVYVTRDWGCIQADFVKPDQRKIANAINRMAANSRMGAERLPEHDKKFKRELLSETKRALDAGVALVQRQIEANTSGDNGDDESPESDG